MTLTSLTVPSRRTEASTCTVPLMFIFCASSGYSGGLLTLSRRDSPVGPLKELFPLLASVSNSGLRRMSARSRDARSTSNLIIPFFKTMLIMPPRRRNPSSSPTRRMLAVARPETATSVRLWPADERKKTT
jgi:hypothetical protein